MNNATVVRIRPPGRDEYGDPLSADSEEDDIPDCVVSPRLSTEVTAPGRQGVVVGLTLYAPYGTDLVHTDQVKVDGVLYELDGEPGPWKSPFSGWEAGVEVALKRAAG